MNRAELKRQYADVMRKRIAVCPFCQRMAPKVCAIHANQKERLERELDRLYPEKEDTCR